MDQISLKLGDQTHAVSPLLYGLFLEDINFSVDGGLNANRIANHSFDGEYMSKSYHMMMAIALKVPPKVKADHLRYWEISGGRLESRDDDPASRKNPWYARVTAEKHAILHNKGYNGGQAFLNQCAIYIAEQHSYSLSAYMRRVSFSGKITASITGEDGSPLTDKVELRPGNVWGLVKVELKAVREGLGQLQLEFDGNGCIDLDCVSFCDADVWGADDPKWSGGHFRKDMVQALKELEPAFVRFPGGCIVEGIQPGNEYQWKNTVGPMIDRIPAVNLWASSFKEKGYSQSYQIGFYEYFLLCEELGATPVPIVWAGLNCQMRSRKSLPTHSALFDEQVLQNALDLIEYANGDPQESPWARLRAEAGHPEPFHLHIIGIGNENFGEDYHAKFQKVHDAVRERYPDMTVILSSGGFPEGKNFEETWSYAKNSVPDVLIDEHFYKPNEWLYEQIHRYDSYPRGTAKVFLGEYAANDIMHPKHKPNTFGSALAEAAFLTGIEKNSDLVVMTSYAPLFCMADGGQWAHNMIYFNPKATMKTVNYYVQQMFSTNVGDRVLSVDGSTPENIFFSATEDDGFYHLKLVNSADAPIQVSVAFPASTDSTAHVTELQCDDMEAANSLTFEGLPEYTVAPVESSAEIADNTLTITAKPHGIYSLRIQKI